MNKPMETLRSGALTPYKDANGIDICVHNYIKDAEGNVYFVNTHLQAVPESDDLTAIELSRLIDKGGVKVMDVNEVLDVKRTEFKKSPKPRGGRRAKADKPAAKAPAKPEKKAKAPKAPKPAAESKKPAEEVKPKAEPEAPAAPAAAEAQQQDGLLPVTQEMILAALPSYVLANELRKRGFMLCAVKPAFIQL